MPGAHTDYHAKNVSGGRILKRKLYEKIGTGDYTLLIASRYFGQGQESRCLACMRLTPVTFLSHRVLQALPGIVQKASSRHPGVDFVVLSTTETEQCLTLDFSH